MSSPKIGSLFSGVGGLDLGVQQVLGGDVVWHVEFDEAPSKVLAHHWPDVPNYGDITQVDWSKVEPIDILTGGFPCQDVSLAGARAGIKDGTRSGLWAHYAHAIEQLKPKMVIIENVRGLLSADAVGAMESDPWGMGNGQPRSVINALGAVLGDLARLGFDARWGGVRAADAGAPHGRFRVFIVATNSQSERRNDGDTFDVGPPGGEVNVPIHTGDAAGRTSGTPAAAAYTADDGHERARTSRNRRTRPENNNLTAADTRGVGLETERRPSRQEAEITEPANDLGLLPGTSRGIDWGIYTPAIERWERALGRPAPAPTNPDGRDGQHRLAAEFVEHMMGLPEGHVTNPAIGLTRNQQLKALGNGVVPTQCALALRMLGVNSWS